MKVLYNTTQNQSPKIVMLEANAIYDEVSIAIPFARIIQNVLPITEYHDRWKSLHWEDFYQKIKYTSTDYMKGFHYRTLMIPANTDNYMKSSEGKKEISEKSKIYLKLMQDYCQKIGARFMIMSVPSTTTWDYEKHNAVQEFAKEEQIDFIDYNILADEINIDWNTDTLDAGEHMNFYGSLKLTDYFEDYVEALEILKDHRGEKNYESWNQDLEEYQKLLDEPPESIPSCSIVPNIPNSELTYSMNRDDYTSNEQFSNFRQIKCNHLKKIIYRGASPIDNTYQRAMITDKLLEENHVNYIINLTNSEQDFQNLIEQNQYSSRYSAKLYQKNKIYFGNLSIDYDSQKYAEDMAKALMQLAKQEEPIYIHCLHGRDRTGMACILIEALSGASYQEILEDYMQTYENYNQITLNTNPDKYYAIVNSRFQNAIYDITREENIEDYVSYDYQKAAEAYLKFGGLTDEDIHTLKKELFY